MTNEEYARLRERDLVEFRGRVRPVVSVSDRSVVFPILRCSWTGRGWTAYTKHEVLRSGRRVGARLAAWPTAWHRAIVAENAAVLALGRLDARYATCCGELTPAGCRAVGADQ